ncbi:magnetosome protein Mad8 [Fundidesulfovibrio magnetotacticus]|uniref:Magnetosome protein Mad8 n=1 Tax=Fundidesulfovibrio magnetotacticus TaxID=2730080 RepID=A0A6V8LMS7_9BACT|nr:hypothetical protein [Fundidesulfovibrio magnetotacticus]GFK92300.1 magnetosome protein Mad8 [Fundidesulfovibrio magnetotacticus]
MNDFTSDYEARKNEIRLRNGSASFKRAKRCDDDLIPLDDLEKPRQVGVMDVLNLGSKVVIGTGVGLLAGVATIAIVASAGELILAGAVTKVAGVVGGAMGLSLGLGSMKKKTPARVE